MVRSGKEFHKDGGLEVMESRESQNLCEFVVTKGED